MTKGLDDVPPDPRLLIEETDWATLTHAFGPAEDTPAALFGLLDDEPGTRTRSLGHLNGCVHHQNSVYPATAPAARYVAAILDDPRTATIVPDSHDGTGFPLRVALLDWLGSVAAEAGNRADAARRRAGFSPEDYPAAAGIKALRPALFQVVSVFFDDPDLRVREAAIAAAVQLLDAPELAHHRAALAPVVHGVLAASANRAYRYIAVHGPDAWGEETEAPPASPAAGHTGEIRGS